MQSNVRDTNRQIIRQRCADTQILLEAWLLAKDGAGDIGADVVTAEQEVVADEAFREAMAATDRYHSTFREENESVRPVLCDSLMFILSGSESNTVKKTDFNEKWDQIMTWSQENVIRCILDKQLAILNNGRKSNVKTNGAKVYNKEIAHENKIKHVITAYACRLCLNEGRERCDPSACFLLHESKGVILHMKSKHKIDLKKRSTTRHLTIPYELPIRVSCESSKAVLEARERIKRWQHLNQLAPLGSTVPPDMFAETDDNTVVGGEKTKYDDIQFMQDKKYNASKPLYSSSPVSEDQKKKLVADDVDVYDLLQTLNKSVPVMANEFSDANIVWNQLLPKFIPCRTDEEMDDMRLERESKEECATKTEEALMLQRDRDRAAIAQEFTRSKKSKKRKNNVADASMLEGAASSTSEA